MISYQDVIFNKNPWTECQVQSLYSLPEVSLRYLSENRLYAFLGIPTIACQNGILCYPLVVGGVVGCGEGEMIEF